MKKSIKLTFCVKNGTQVSYEKFQVRKKYLNKVSSRLPVHIGSSKWIWEIFESKSISRYLTFDNFTVSIFLFFTVELLIKREIQKINTIPPTILEIIIS